MSFKKTLLWIGTIGTIIAPTITTIACESTSNALDPSKKNSAIMIVGQAGHDDKGFLQGAYEGAQEAIKQIKNFTKYSEIKIPSSEIPQTKVGVQNALKAGAYIIYGVGYQYPTFINSEEFAGKYKNREFVGIDGLSKNNKFQNLQPHEVKDNVTNIAFRAEQSSFLSGIAAAIYLAKNKATYEDDGGLKIGAFGGSPYSPIKAMLEGFMQGIAYYNDNLAKDSTFKVKFIGWDKDADGFTGGFTANPNSFAKAKVLLDKKPDIVFPVAGGQVNSMVDAIKTDNNIKTKIIGVDSDQNEVFGQDGKYFITSSLKNTKIAILEATKAIYGLPTLANLKKGQNNIVGLDGLFVSIAKGRINSDDFQGSELQNILKLNNGIIENTTDTLYMQLVNKNNKAYKYALTIKLNWQDFFGKKSDGTWIPTKTDFTSTSS